MGIKDRDREYFASFLAQGHLKVVRQILMNFGKIHLPDAAISIKLTRVMGGKMESH